MKRLNRNSRKLRQIERKTITSKGPGQKFGDNNCSSVIGLCVDRDIYITI